MSGSRRVASCRGDPAPPPPCRPCRGRGLTVGADAELEHEQRKLAEFYARLDELRERAARDLDRVRRTPPTGTPGSRSERDAFAALHAERLAQLRAVEERLCFGRLDRADGRRHHIGRVGLADDDQRQLLVDWRAPAAEPFYQATAASPQGLLLRRHITSQGRRVTAIADDVLDLDAVDDVDPSTLSGESSLLAALNARRTGRMRDIVATIQAEQDRIIRAPLPGVLVVQGGPGTGKTAVALHRAAYLLYTHRERIARSGVLLVGPNPVFLRYIGQVLPSLGETGAVLATPGTLFPGIEATGREPPETAALKGDLRMADVVAEAVRRRQRVPPKPLRLDVDGTVITLRPTAVAESRTRARRSRRPHNEARTVFVRDLLNHLAQRLARARGTELDEDNRADLLGDLRDSRDVRREVNLAWMPLTPQKLLADLYADPGQLAAVAPHLSEPQRRQLHRPRGSAWTTADVPLLDEAAELLGEDDSEESLRQARASADRRAELEYARGVLQMTGAGEMLTAETLVDRYASDGPVLTVAERAATDRTWTFGHVVVDEAQELSPMQWRLLFRRCPSRSLTVVGDVAQTGSLGGATDWGQVLEPHAADRWRVEELTVNYRTPQQIMEVATDVLAEAGVPVAPPRSAREATTPPVAQRVKAGDQGAVVEAVRREIDHLGEGRLAVLTSARLVDRLGVALREALPPGSVATGADALGAAVSVLGVADVKGLEFDSVVLVEPAEILEGSPRGAADLYVALTRPTQRLRVLHSGRLPRGLRRLSVVTR